MTQSKQELRADTYTTTAEFAAIPRHEAVAFADNGALVAVTGPAGDPRARRFALLFAAAPEMLEALRHEAGTYDRVIAAIERHRDAWEHIESAHQAIDSVLEWVRGMRDANNEAGLAGTAIRKATEGEG